MGDREDANDDPRVRRDQVPLLRGPEEEVQILLQELVEVLPASQVSRGQPLAELPLECLGDAVAMALLR